MAMTEGEPDVFFEGSVPEILSHAKERLVGEAHTTIEQQTGQLPPSSTHIHYSPLGFESL